MAKLIFAVIGKPEMIDDLYDIADAVADPHLQQREVLVDVEDDDLGSIPVHNIVPRLSGTPGVWRHQASFLASIPMRCSPQLATRRTTSPDCIPTGQWPDQATRKLPAADCSSPAEHTLPCPPIGAVDF